MSLDSTLLGEVQNLASQSFAQLMNPSFGLENALKTILFEWAGAENVDPTVGGIVNSQELQFVEQLMGQNIWNQTLASTISANWTGSEVAAHLNQAWDVAFSYITAHLLAQAGFNSLLGRPTYDPVSDTLYDASGHPYDVAVQFADQAVGGFELQHLATNDIFVLFPGDAPVSGPANSPTLYIYETPNGGGTNTLALGVGHSGVLLSDDRDGNLYVHYTSTDTVEVLGRMATNGANLAGTTVGEYLQQIAFDDGTVWNLTGGLHLTATPNYLSLYGTVTGGDTLDAGGLDAFLQAFTGDNTLIAGPGAVLNGGDGTDLFVINPGSAPASAGGVTINPNAEATGDQIVLHGVTESQVVMSDNSSGQLLITTSNGDLATVNGGSLNFSTGVTPGNVAGVDFDDGTIWTIADGIHLTATAANLTVYGINGGGDTLDANGLDALLWGFNGDNTFIAGPGSTINGGSGTDLFVINPGSAPASSGGVMINPNGSATDDQIVLHGVTESQVFLSDDSSGDLIVSTSNGDLVTVHGGSYAYGTGVTLGNVAGITLDDSTVLDLTGIVTLTPTGPGSLLGISTGTDFVANGYENNFYGFNSHDVFSFTAGSAPAASYGVNVYEYASGGTSTIAFHGLTPSEVVMSDDSSGDLIFQFGTDLVTVAGGNNTGSGITVGNVQQATFDDSTVWNLQSGLDLTATGNSQNLYGTTSGGDTLTAAGIGDSLHAYAGTETLVAGTAAYLYNGTGTDTDVFSVGTASTSYGGDTVLENATGGTSTIAFHGVDPSAVTLSDNSFGQLLIAFSPTDLITVSGGNFSGSGFTLGSLQQITFDNSSHTIWDLTGGLNLTAVGNFQNLYGTTSGGDTLTADGTSDNLYAYGGFEALVAGALSSLHNGTGNDIDVFSTGFGSATLYANASGGSSNTIVFHGVTAADLAISDDVFGQLTIQDSSGDQLLVSGGSYSSTTGFSVGNIEQIALDGGTSIDLTGSLNLTATSDNQYLYGTGHGDDLTALGNNDHLYAIAGNNTMTGNSSSSSSTFFNGGSGNDLMIVEGGTNYINAGTGADTYSIANASSSTSINGFSEAKGDVLSFENILEGTNVLSNVGNYVQETTRGGNTQFSVDPTGTGNFTAGPLVTLNGVTGLEDVATMIAHGHLLVHS